MEKKLISLLQNLMFTANKMPYYAHNQFELIRIGFVSRFYMKRIILSCVV